MLSMLSIQWISILSILAGEASEAEKRPETRFPLVLRVKIYRGGEEEGRTQVTEGCDGEVDSG
jgi:hypothetical protein